MMYTYTSFVYVYQYIHQLPSLLQDWRSVFSVVDMANFHWFCISFAGTLKITQDPCCLRKFTKLRKKVALLKTVLCLVLYNFKFCFYKIINFLSKRTENHGSKMVALPKNNAQCTQVWNRHLKTHLFTYSGTLYMEHKQAHSWGLHIV